MGCAGQQGAGRSEGEGEREGHTNAPRRVYCRAHVLERKEEAEHHFRVVHESSGAVLDVLRPRPLGVVQADPVPVEDVKVVAHHAELKRATSPPPRCGHRPPSSNTQPTPLSRANFPNGNIGFCCFFVVHNGANFSNTMGGLFGLFFAFSTLPRAQAIPEYDFVRFFYWIHHHHLGVPNWRAACVISIPTRAAAQIPRSPVVYSLLIKEIQCRPRQGGTPSLLSAFSFATEILPGSWNRAATRAKASTRPLALAPRES